MKKASPKNVGKMIAHNESYKPAALIKTNRGTIVTCHGNNIVAITMMNVSLRPRQLTCDNDQATSEQDKVDPITQPMHNKSEFSKYRQ